MARAGWGPLGDPRDFLSTGKDIRILLKMQRRKSMDVMIVQWPTVGVFFLNPVVNNLPNLHLLRFLTILMILCSGK